MRVPTQDEFAWWDSARKVNPDITFEQARMLMYKFLREKRARERKARMH